jgi:sugar porter (SP) family MFS transporter
VENVSKNRSFVYFIGAIAAMGGLLFGYDTGVISGALLFIKQEWTLSAIQQGWLVSSVLVGAVLGAAFSGKTTDFFGRRNVVITTAIIFFIGSVGTALAPDITWLISFRILIGVAIGIASFTVPLYLSEISPDNIRGAMVSLNQLAITIGIVLSYVIDQTFASFAHGWRYMFFVGVLPSAVLGIGMFFLPDSPRWLLSKGYDEKARKVLEKISANVDETINKVKKNIEEEKNDSWKEIFAVWLRPAMIIGIVLMFFQQFTGINTVIYYAPTIFQMTGFQSAKAAIFATVIVGIVNVLMTIVSIKLIDRLGRKPLLYIGLSGMILSLSVLGIAFQATVALGFLLKWVAIGSLIVYIASFAISLGPVCWLIISEIYPLKIRGLAMSIATVSNWGFNFLVALMFLPMVQKLGTASTFWFFALMSVAGVIFCYLYVPETKGYSLEEIEEHWLQGKHPRELGGKISLDEPLVEEAI